MSTRAATGHSKNHPTGTELTTLGRTRVVQAVDALPAGQRGGLPLPLQRGVVLQADPCPRALLLGTLLRGVVAGEGKCRPRALLGAQRDKTNTAQTRYCRLDAICGSVAGNSHTQYL